MQSFRTEIENPVVEKDIIELAQKIELFQNGKIDEERFRSLRLARGVYGQRQEGVQMIRIKLPYGKVSSRQLNRIADVADEYSTGRLHITTRQDIQIHYVDLNRTPQLWAELERDEVTLREACGNTVRNVTASEMAGIDPEEPFDVSPYAQAVFEYFLRNPICQEMGRKFKVSFSSSDRDTGLSYMHDLGFIAKVCEGERGFKVLIGGGLGSQPRHADVLYEFLPTDQIIPLMEGVLRIFDRHGERKSRAKARMKFLIKEIGLEGFKTLLEAEQLAIEHRTVSIDTSAYRTAEPSLAEPPTVPIENQEEFDSWKATNVLEQKQAGFVAIGIKVLLGDFYTDTARALAQLVQQYAASELRLTLRQNIIIPFVREEALPFFYTKLSKLGMTEIGYNKAVDITACPGTDTCNLGIASSTGITSELERVLKTEYPELIAKDDLVIKISGCMNACGQHTMANIGFQGMSIRTKDKLVAPALQVLLGGANTGNGTGRFADKVVKVPSRRGPEALRRILNDFKDHANGLNFADYYALQGESYFYDLLKELSNSDNLSPEDFIDWGAKTQYVKAIGIGECAGVVIDLVATLFLESEEKIEKALAAVESRRYANAIYHAYSALVNTAKALLVADNQRTNSHAAIIRQFDELYVETKQIPLETSFSELVYQIKNKAPERDFALGFIEEATVFLKQAVSLRKQQLETTA